ncbi:hypothetical protein [Mariprofundus ferrooxydans]|uniref:Uncharacterized protein n=1 Tax=Mariprofundus ferrooxydans PV-1 TaxID=314345 RepID=Q0EWR8_9PROT|nr:hypothetical protein [Mariprofundus ferrooxydans]EAU53721.1 hypothetical protein SPV1_06264 [Mariprofundus ferrooxydans PV-1]
MLVKFIPTKKSGTSIDAVLAYVFQEKDADGKPRPVVKQVTGTMPELLSLMSLDIPSKTPYTHSVLSFSDSDMERTTEAQRLQILDSYIDELAAGLCDKGRMPYMAVSHGDHYHVVTLRYDLGSGKVYQPFVTARGDTQRFNAWKDVVNATYGLDAPCKSGTLFRLSAKHVAEDIKNLLWLLNDEGRYVFDGADGEITAHELLNELEPLIHEEGFEIARTTTSGFSVTTSAMKRNVRIQFTRKALGYADEERDEDVYELKERLACFREKLMCSMGRYHEGVVPEFRSGSHFSAFQCYFADNKRRNETAIPSFAAAALQ